MKVFEYGLLKDGNHRLAYIKAVLVNDSEVGPAVLTDYADGHETLGEIHDLTAVELKNRDWLYSAFTRVPMKTTDGERVQVYALKRPSAASGVARDLWVLPRQNGTVYHLTTSDGAAFEGSLRELLLQLYRDQWTVDGKGRFKEEVARRIRVLGGRRVRTETLLEFFRDLHAARAIRLRRIWPTKPGGIFPN